MVSPIQPSLAGLPLFVPKGQRDPSGSFDRAFAADPIGTVLQGYETCGPIFRINHHGEERVAMAGIEANKFVWGDNQLWDYPTSNRHFREQFSDRYLNQLEGAEYMKKRRRVAAGFKPSVIMQHTTAMGEAVHAFVAKAQGDWVPLRLFCMQIIIAMTSRALMQVDLPEGMDRCMAIHNKHMLKAESLGPWRHLFYLRPDRLWRRKVIFDYLGKIIDRREREGAPTDDILSLCLQAHPEDEPPIPRYEMVHDLSQLMMAGSTTTSQTILWNLMFTATHPEWREEIMAELANWSTDGFTNMGDWPKLKAACLEIERLRPPSMLFHRLSKKDFAFAGHDIPASSWVTHLHTVGHFINECYPDPLAFRPQRFLEDPDLPRRDVHGLFGGGAHRCAGIPLARVLMPVGVGNLLAYYDMEFREAPQLDARLDVVLAPKQDVWVRFKRRRD